METRVDPGAYRRARWIDPAQYGRLLAAAEGDPDAWMLFYVTANLGLRVCEAHRLRAGDVCAADATVLIRTAKQRTPDVTDELPVPRSVADVLRRWIDSLQLKGDDLLFRWSPRTSQRMWDHYAKRAGLKVVGREGAKGRGIHALRHLRGLLLAERNVPLYEAMRLMRHRDVGSTVRYFHSRRLREAAEGVGEIGKENNER